MAKLLEAELHEAARVDSVDRVDDHDRGISGKRHKILNLELSRSVNVGMAASARLQAGHRHPRDRVVTPEWLATREDDHSRLPAHSLMPPDRA
jgi:hypothetical protein